MPPPPDRREELLRWIAASRRLQIRMGFGLGAATIAAVALMLLQPSIGKLALAMIAIVVVCAYWVTGSHILDWRNRLEALEQQARKASRGAKPTSE
jgi:hypothetical protein